MSDLSPEAAALLESARRTHGPDESDRERVLRSLHVSLGIVVPAALIAGTAQAAGSAQAASQLGVGGAAAGQGASAVQTASMVQTSLTQAASGQGLFASKGALSFGAKLLTWKAGKVFLATVALGSAVGVSSLPRASKVERARVETDTTHERTTQAIARGRAHDDDTGRGQAQASATTEPGTSPQRVDGEPSPPPRLLAEPDEHAANQDEASEAAPAVALASSSEREPRRKSRARTSHGSERARTRVSTTQARVATRTEERAAAPVEASTTTAAVSAPDVLPQGETQLIRRALTSLRDRDAVTALTLLDEHALHYPSGAFTTERRGLHVIALCQAGRIAEGKAEREAFLSRLGNAPIAARVRTACVETKK